MKRSALLLLTTVGMILAGAGVTELLGDDSSEGPPVATLAKYWSYPLDESPAMVCVRTDAGGDLHR